MLRHSRQRIREGSLLRTARTRGRFVEKMVSHLVTDKDAKCEESFAYVCTRRLDVQIIKGSFFFFLVSPYNSGVINEG